jgi:DNA helicase-2/ATP-dependent DNA helicase PcrA
MQHDPEQVESSLPSAEPPDFESPPIEAYFGETQAFPKDSHEHDEFEAAEAQRRQARDSLFERLNDAQREAVFAGSSSSLVLAAAGSGKTSVLTARIARLVTAGAGQGALPASAILAVTFTNKAAQEMRNRLLGLLDRQTVNKIWVGTFHSLCARLLRDNAEEAGLPKTFAILDVDGQEAMCRGILKDMGLTKTAAREARRQREASSQAMLGLDDAAAPAAPDRADRLLEAGAIVEAEEGEDDGTELVTPAQCARYIGSRKEAQHPPHPPRDAVSRRSTQIDQFEAVYAEYEARCRRGGLLDFADLLSRAVSLLKSNATVREALQQRLRAILVDEFQDTNDLQYQWLGLITGKHAHVMAVGDDDQSIYAFRGAKPENMQRFLRDFASTRQHPDGLLIRLEHNYRSLPHILDAANAVIANNDNRLGKVLRTTRAGAGERIELLHHVNGPQEAAAVASTIHRLVRQERVPPSEIAVLYRANQQSRLLEAELNKHGIPLTVYGGFRFYERQEIKYAMAYLDLVCDATHDISFAKVANFPPRGLGETTIEELRQDAQVRRVSMMEMVALRQQWREESALPGGAGALRRQVTLEQLVEMIVRLAESAAQMQLHELLEQVIVASGLGAHYAQLAREEGSEDSERLANLAELVSAARQFVADNPQLEALDTLGQLGEYLSHVALMTSTSESDMSTKNTVSLMTVHSAKGLEFDHVFVTGLEEDTFPHSRAAQEDADAAAMREIPDRGNGPGIQEERRLMYVALTRARKHLMLSYCNERMINGKVEKMQPSRFLDELAAQQLRITDLTPKAAATTTNTPPAGRTAWSPAPGSPSTPSRSHPAAVGPSQGQPLQPDRPSAFAALASAASRPSNAMPPMPSRRSPLAHEHLPVPPHNAPAARATGRRVAIIGTAGRDKARATDMNADLWLKMLADAREHVTPSDVLVSGGAAWADHLAVELFLEGRVAGLKLHLPAPLNASGRFEGGYGTSGGAANYYHDRFRQATGIDSLARLVQATAQGASFTEEPLANGYAAMAARNRKVAQECNSLLAYTWGPADVPEDGGTRQTWDLAQHAARLHVRLEDLCHDDTNAEQANNLRRRAAAGQPG